MIAAPTRRFRRALIVVAALAAVAALASVPSAAAAPHRSGSTATLGAHYARIQPVCHAPKPGHASCMALRRVEVPKGTKGAVALPSLVGAHGPHRGYSPADLAGAYGLNTAAATHSVVAVVDAYDDPVILRELNHFDRHYGLPRETKDSFQVVKQVAHTADGQVVPPRTNWGWATEAALDVEAVRGMCNQCTIMLVEAYNAISKNLAWAENTAARLGADVISNSFGAPEQGLRGSTREQTRALLRAYRHPGVVITAATGDDGWYDWDFVNTEDGAGHVGLSDNMPNAPASLPSVIAVGGTTLTLDADGKRVSETVWNDNGKDDDGVAIGASGGGCSTRFRAPSWQASVAGYENTGCGKRRMAGDVAAVGDPATGYSVYAPSPGDTGDGWQVLGGTSLAAPLIAGMYGLAGGSGGVRYPSLSLYLNYRYHPHWAHDVRHGGNSFCGGDTVANCSAAVRAKTASDPTGNPNNLADGSDTWLGLLDCSFAFDGSEKTIAANTQCNAAPGYDGPSGVGTPNGVRLLRSARATVQLDPPRRVHAGRRQTYRAVHFRDTLAPAVRYVWHWGDGSGAEITRVPHATHVFVKPGRYRVWVRVWDKLHRHATAVVRLTAH